MNRKYEILYERLHLFRSAWKAQKAISAEEGLIAIPYERKQVILIISPLEFEILIMF
jgi:hypothetical protein